MKKNITMSVDIELFSLFKAKCRTEHRTMSSVFDNMIRKYLESEIKSSESYMNDEYITDDMTVTDSIDVDLTSDEAEELICLLKKLKS